MFKFSYDQSLQVLEWTFTRNSEWCFQIDRKTLSLKYELDAIPYRASKLWQEVPIDIREAASLV